MKNKNNNVKLVTLLHPPDFEKILKTI